MRKCSRCTVNVPLNVFKGIVAFSLWFERGFGVRLAIADAIIGILFCVLSMARVLLMSASPSASPVRLELVALIPYLIKMVKIKAVWEKR